MILVNGWRTWWRQWSTWLAGIGLAAIQLAPELAEALNYVWINTPLDIKSAFTPEQVRIIGIVIAAASIPAKLVRQRKLHAEVQESERGGAGAH